MHRAEGGNAAWRALAGLVATVALATATGDLMAEGKHIVYIEASTVNNWKLDGIAARTGSERYRFEVLREYDFDKSKTVDQVLAGGQPRPGAVIVQECAVYFPGDLQAYQGMYRGWIEKLQARGLRPVIATVVPPARSRGWWQDAKDFAKERLLRVSAEDRHMRPEFNAGDGIHLAPVAYLRLDRDLLEFLDRLELRTEPK